MPVFVLQRPLPPFRLFKVIRSSRGFTLIEIILVILMLSLIVGLVAPTIVGSMKRSQLKKITDDLVGAIRYTRSQAMIKNKAQRIIFDLKESRYVIPEKEKVVQVPKHLNINLLTAESERQGNTSGAIRFYPDGSSTGGRVTLTEKDKRWVVHVAWLTGKVKLVRYNIDGENE